MLAEQIEGAAHAAEHADAEHVDLHDLQFLEIVLLPFDHLPVDHRRRLYGHEVVEPVAGEDEAAGMLGEVARRADQLAGQLQGEGEPGIVLVETELLHMLFGDAVVRPAPDLARQGAGHVFGKAQRLADLAHRPAGAIAADHGGERGVAVAIGPVDPLDHLLAPLMFEIDVDVGRLVAVVREEALEQQSVDTGSIEVTPRMKQIIELAAEPRP